MSSTFLIEALRVKTIEWTYSSNRIIWLPPFLKALHNKDDPGPALQKLKATPPIAEYRVVGAPETDPTVDGIRHGSASV